MVGALLLFLVLLTMPLAAEAQQAGKVYQIGFLGNSTAALEINLVGPFREGLRDLGYVEGQTVVIVYRWAEGKYERLPALVAELIGLKVDVIVAAGTPAADAVKKATSSIPLVMVAVGDPVATGLVASLARPGETSQDWCRLHRTWRANGWSCSGRWFRSSPPSPS